MVTITEAREIDASLDDVWAIICDLDKDHEYWSGLTSISSIRRDGNLIEREAVVGFMGRKGKQRIELVPKTMIHMTMVDGPLIGSRDIRLVPSGPRKTRIDVSWNIQFSEIPDFAQGFVRARLEQTTREALDKLAKAVGAAKN